MPKTIFITGASSGMGKATAIYFQRKGWNVIATMRHPEKENELNQLDGISILPLDVTNPKQIQSTVIDAESIHPIDVVFNNAGYGLMGSLESLSDEQIVKQINTNLLGVIRVTKEFVPYFRKRKSGVFISTTSMGGFLAYPLHSIYHAAKFGVEGWSESMSFELGLHGIRIKTVAPGATSTDFLGRSLERYNHPAYTDLENKLFGASDAMMDSGIPAEKVAETVYEAATDDKDQIRYLIGDDTKTLYARRSDLGSEDFRKEVRKNILGDH